MHFICVNEYYSPCPDQGTRCVFYSKRCNSYLTLNSVSCPLGNLRHCALGKCFKTAFSLVVKYNFPQSRNILSLSVQIKVVEAIFFNLSLSYSILEPFPCSLRFPDTNRVWYFLLIDRTSWLLHDVVNVSLTEGLVSAVLCGSYYIRTSQVIVPPEASPPLRPILLSDLGTAL